VNWLLDTNVVSELRRKQPDGKVLAWFRRTDPATLHLSVLTLGEIVKGAEAWPAAIPPRPARCGPGLTACVAIMRIVCSASTARWPKPGAACRPFGLCR
jgi:hypothetical protein